MNLICLLTKGLAKKESAKVREEGRGQKDVEAKAAKLQPSATRQLKTLIREGFKEKSPFWLKLIVPIKGV